ncbi:YidB family protein [Hydrogenophaga defluvii]|uniref:YidB family protein n=1 Tax=Hydrogenophaga defluvii TaxID=249410 RepID=A0ABW2SC98_9BURK
MDLLKSVLGGLAAAAQGNAAQTPAAGAGLDMGQLAALAPVLMELLSGKGGGAGGLGGLVAQLNQAGLGDIVQSWIGRGQNMPVSGNQLESALGSDVLGQLGGQLGMNGGQLGDLLAQALPGLIDRMTPDGQLPQGGVGQGPDLGALLGQLLR